jgi:hypothetical protein
MQIAQGRNGAPHVQLDPTLVILAQLVVLSVRPAHSTPILILNLLVLVCSAVLGIIPLPSDRPLVLSLQRAHLFLLMGRLGIAHARLERTASQDQALAVNARPVLIPHRP